MSAKHALNEHNAISKALSQKWGYLLEGIKSESIRGTTAILLENESQRGSSLMLETTSSGQSASSGGSFDFSAANGTGTGNDIAPFQHYLLPLVRRVYPNLIANELVGVQPMTSPASLVFYLKYKYTGLVNPDVVSGASVVQTASTKGLTAAGTEYGNFSGNTWAIDPYYSLQTVFRENVFGGTSALNVAMAALTDANGILAATHFDTADQAPIATPVIPGTLTVGVIGVSYITIRAETVGNADQVDLTYVLSAFNTTTGVATFTYSSATQLTGGAFTAAPAGAALTLSLTFSVTDGTYTSCSLLDLTAVAVDGALVDSVIAGGTASVTRTYDYNMEGNRTLPEMELQVESNPVAAKTRKLRTKWTIEAAQDLRAMHNIDAEQELIAVLANEVTAEIDREIINDLLVNSAIRVDYDYSSPFIVGGVATAAANPATVGGLAGTYTPNTGSAVTTVFQSMANFDDRNKALFYQILECAAQIYRQSLRGSGNWIVTSPEVSAKLESLTEFKPDARSDTTYNMGIQYSGTLNGAFKVYKDPLFPRDKILVGYKGQSFMDAGYFYCPYVPLQLTPTVLDTESFNPRKGLITRYGKVLVENGARMYARITVHNLAAIGSNGLPGYYNGTVADAQKNGQAISSAVSGSDLI